MQQISPTDDTATSGLQKMKRFFKLKSSSKSGYSEKKNVMYNQTNVLALTALTALHADDFDNSDDSIDCDESINSDNFNDF